MSEMNLIKGAGNGNLTLYSIVCSTVEKGYVDIIVPSPYQRTSLLFYGDGNGAPYCGNLYWSGVGAAPVNYKETSVVSTCTPTASLIDSTTLRITTTNYDTITIISTFKISAK